MTRPGPTVAAATANPLHRDLIEVALREQGVDLVDTASSLAGLLRCCAERSPQVVVSDSNLGSESLQAGLPVILAGGARVLVFCADASTEGLVEVLLGGASGYLLLRDSGPAQLAEAVRSVAQGDAALHPGVAASILEQWRALQDRGGSEPAAKRLTLTPREQEVLDAMVEGLGNKAMAIRMGVAAKTVEQHKARIFDKLGVNTQAQAVSVALRNGLVEPPVERPPVQPDGSRHLRSPDRGEGANPDPPTGAR